MVTNTNKVARKTLVDSFATLVTEQNLLADLPQFFTPDKVLRLDDATLTKIAGEPETAKAERERLKQKIRSLEMGLSALKSLSPYTVGAGH